MRGPKHQDGRALLGGELQPEAERRRDGLPATEGKLPEIERHEGNPRTADEQISRAEGDPQPAAALDPEEPAEIRAGRDSGGRIEPIRPIYQRGVIAGSGDAGDQGEEQAAPP